METESSWGCCNTPKNKDRYIKCLHCKKGYHFGCLGMDSHSSALTNWNCPKCNRYKTTDETPVRTAGNRTNSKATDFNVTKRSYKRQALSSPTSPITNEQITHDNIRSIVSDAIEKQMSNLMVSINKTITNSIDTHFKRFENKIEELQTSVTFMSNQYEDMKQQLDMHCEVTGQLKHDNEALQTTVNTLQNKINIMEQQARANNIEIQCVPESKTENLTTIVKELSKSINLNIKDNEIAHCYRIAKMNLKSTRPRSIIVQLSASLVRDQFIAAVIKYNKSNPSNKLNSSHLGIGGNKVPVYVCEHLTTANKSLHAAARKKGKELQYKHIWVRNGRIFMRKTDDSDYKLINDMDSLNKLT